MAAAAICDGCGRFMVVDRHHSAASPPSIHPWFIIYHAAFRQSARSSLSRLQILSEAVVVS
jgi:hypothetical protein